MGNERYLKELLKNVATLIMGQSPPGSTYNEFGEGVPFYQGVRDFGERYPTRRVYCTAPTRFAKADDVLFSVRAPIGEINRATEDCSIGRGLAAIRADSYLDTTYIEYVLRYIRREWEILEGQGAVFGNAKKSDLENLSVPWPKDEKRRGIAHILGSLDDKIELNRKMNETLEAMARAIFKSWFVDFDPVRARRGEPLCSPNPGLPDDIADLFPDSFEDSVVQIPKGWEVKNLDALASVIRGRSYKSSELQNSSTALVTLKSFKRGGGYKDDGLKPYTGYYKPEQLVRPGELVVAQTDVTQKAEVIGKPAIVRKDSRYSKLVASLDTVIVRTIGDEVSIPFLYYLFLTDDFQAHSYSHATGTTVLHLSKNAIPSYEFRCPPREVVKSFTKMAETIFHKIDANEQECCTLASLRDTLLPKLISGELRVPDAEKLMEGVE